MFGKVNSVTEYSEMPSMGLMFLKALVSFKPRELKSGQQVPILKGIISNVAIDEENLNTFESICQADTAEYLHSCYPHLVANPIMMNLLTHRDFPVKAIGLVHVRHEITQYRRIRRNEKLNIVCETSDARESRKGLEFDIETKIYSAEELVWQSTGCFLSLSLKNIGTVKKKKIRKKVASSRPWVIEEWNLASDLGRKYADVSGDYNPIHIHPITSKLFGFSQPIAHGMWSLAHCASRLVQDREKFSISIVFKSPILLPSNVNLNFIDEGNAVAFKVSSKTQGMDYLTGNLSTL